MSSEINLHLNDFASAGLGWSAKNAAWQFLSLMDTQQAVKGFLFFV